MKNPHFILLTLLSLLPILSGANPASVTASSSLSVARLAAEPFSAPEPIPSPGGKPPQPISSTPHFSYWKGLWDNGASADQAFLSGDWKMVGRATTSACGYTFVDGYSEQGIKNGDGSDYSSLNFSDFPSGADHLTTFGVRVKGMGLRNYSQGPYAVDTVEPQFSTWIYRGENLTKDGYSEWSCRAISASDTALICMVHMHIDDPIDSVEAGCAADPYGAAYAYVKK